MEFSTVISMPTLNQLVLLFVAIMCVIVWSGSFVKVFKQVRTWIK